MAAELESWVSETDVDGFNLAYIVTPESFADFAELVVPELQRRGLYKLNYRAGASREKLYGPGRSRLPDNHPAARYRFRGDTSAPPTSATSPPNPASSPRTSTGTW